ncbi:MAG: hypothetical protein LT071_06325, partial [Nocardioides sp.]|nr:hypothetical protein [Nocardioides sp.]
MSTDTGGNASPTAAAGRIAAGEVDDNAELIDRLEAIRGRSAELFDVLLDHDGDDQERSSARDELVHL